jgi:hypothetical protein
MYQEDELMLYYATALMLYAYLLVQWYFFSNANAHRRETWDSDHY